MLSQLMRLTRISYREKMGISRRNVKCVAEKEKCVRGTEGSRRGRAVGLTSQTHPATDAEESRAALEGILHTSRVKVLENTTSVGQGAYSRAISVLWGKRSC